MKNKFKLQGLILALAVSIAACNGNKSSSNGDSVTTTSTSVKDTTRHADSIVKVDTIKRATDTSDAKTDTVSKTVHSKTEIKKISVKKAKEQ
ncbi:hypothetical protein [Mucilaginibacter flavidus]|uniref:hypothetical protein n=1 Tax=Mucilaginibacter flavidus TaxID=2949309 RepID=UPI0020934B82|nr:hypothetical protein [Mucilaginibacter flavidus]MCO5946922.1 hypothetical protein [Mucilaginibacter flavidus]